MYRSLFCAIVLMGMLVAHCVADDQPTTQPTVTAVTRPAPDPSMSPTDVVKAQMTAMQHNDEPTADAGIATVFEFASPGNREKTGPLERFTKMVKTPAYAPMLGFVKAEYSPVKVAGDEAQQFVRITDSQGKRFIYLFMLSKQADGQYKDCWMTDGVVPAEAHGPPPPPTDGQGGDQPVKT